MMQQYVNGKGFKGPSEAEQRLIDEAKKRLDFLGANPEAKEFKPKNSTQDLPVKTPIVYIKNPLVVYKEEEQNVTCTYCLAGTLPNHQPSVWTKCRDNKSDLNNTYSSSYEETPTMYSSNNEYWLEEVNHIDLAPCSYEEYYPEYLTPASPRNSSSNNVYWVEGQEMAQNDESFYNQTTYYSVDQTQMDNVWLEPTPTFK